MTFSICTQKSRARGETTNKLTDKCYVLRLENSENHVCGAKVSEKNINAPTTKEG